MSDRLQLLPLNTYSTLTSLHHLSSHTTGNPYLYASPPSASVRNAGFGLSCTGDVFFLQHSDSPRQNMSQLDRYSTSDQPGRTCARNRVINRERLPILKREGSANKYRHLPTKPRMHSRRSNQDSRVMKCLFQPCSPPLTSFWFCRVPCQSSKNDKMSMRRSIWIESTPLM